LVNIIYDQKGFISMHRVYLIAGLAFLIPGIILMAGGLFSPFFLLCFAFGFIPFIIGLALVIIAIVEKDEGPILPTSDVAPPPPPDAKPPPGPPYP
jgi:hypothetical protein